MHFFFLLKDLADYFAMIGYTLKSKFWPIFGFFHGQKVVFTPTFFPKIWAFSRPLFFHGHVFGFFSRVEKFVFTGRNQKIFIFYFQFNGEKDGISSRASTSVSRVEFLEKFHGQISIFTVAFWGIFGLFHGHIFFHGHFWRNYVSWCRIPHDERY